MSQGTLDASVKIGSDEIGVNEVHDIIVEADLDHPDMAAVTLSNQSTQWSNKVKEGDTVEVNGGLTSQKAGTLFKGEVVGIEPVFSASRPSRVLIRAFNKLHVLARGKKSVAYTKVSDADIVQKICSNANLTANFGDQKPTDPKYDHVYQHNQTDLEFIRLRAARIGFEVFCQDTTLYFRKRTDKDSGIKLQIGSSGETVLESFTPRLSTANQVSEVRVRAWDTEQKKEIVGSAKPQSSKLGSKTGSAVADGVHSNVLYIDVDVPVFTAQEANNVAKSILQDRLMSFITGEGVTKANPDLKPGLIVDIECGCSRFDGKYYITAVRHRYMHEGPDHGFRTYFKVRRDARDQ
jgi:phage protein D